MNPLNNDFFGQVQHREYEARYGQHVEEKDTAPARSSFVSGHKVAVALSGATVIIAAIIAFGV
ncbi:MAG: hypothetical protein R3300_01465 [Candidatus Promineifilaceae bacterium]|nr:hypothetical protein [Candidatus Promineifilaceae bacterium]